MSLLSDWRESPYPLLIDGTQVRTDRSFATVDPATEEVIGTASDATLAELDEAIAAARRAFDGSGWAADLPLRATGRAVNVVVADVDEKGAAVADDI